MRVGLIASVLLALTGCAVSLTTPWTYIDNREMAGRPGLFSGPEGGFTIIRQ